MPNWEINQLVLFLLFIIPGFITMKTYELLVPSSYKETAKQIIDVIAYSCMNYAILFSYIIMIEKLHRNNEYTFLYYIVYLVVFLIGPITWAFLWKYLRESNIFQDYIPHPIHKAWDYVFSKRKSYWVKVTLKNGHVLGGLYSSKSFSSSEPAPTEIFLQESWIINDKGGFERKKMILMEF